MFTCDKMKILENIKSYSYEFLFNILLYFVLQLIRMLNTNTAVTL